MERYWEIRVELVSSLKEGATSGLMTVHEVKSEVPEGIYVMDVEGASYGEPLAKGLAHTTAITSSPILPLSRYAHATQATLAFLRVAPDFEPLQAFELRYRRITEVSVRIRCNGYKISDGRRTIRPVPCV